MPVFVPRNIEKDVLQELNRLYSGTAMIAGMQHTPDATTWIRVVCIGGKRTSPVMDRYEVQLEIAASSHEEAMSMAGKLAGFIANLPDDEQALNSWRSAAISKLPHTQLHEGKALSPTVALVAEFMCRAE